MDIAHRTDWRAASARGASTLLALAIALWLVANLTALVDWPGWLDEALHAASWFAIALLTGLGLDGRSLTGARERPLLFVATVVLVATGLGALWEVAEWLFVSHVPGAPRGLHTDWAGDLIVDVLASTVGAAAALGLLRRSKTRRATTR